MREAPALVRSARADAGLTQAELARRAGIQQSSLAQIEGGRRAVSEEMLERILSAADYRPSVALAAYADRIIELGRRRGLVDIRVFGSALAGEDGFHSDIDLVVTPEAGTDLFDVLLFAAEVEELTGFPVDAVSDQSRAAQDGVMASALASAVPL